MRRILLQQREVFVLAELEQLPHTEIAKALGIHANTLANRLNAARARPCKASEVVQFTDPSAGKEAPLAVQVHNAGMIEEFKDLYVESPVADPNTLVTTK